MGDFFLADDLSGALDAAAPLCGAYGNVTIALSPSAWSRRCRAALVGLTTETRNAPPEEAAKVVRHVLALGQKRGGTLIYKKIDSTLRGPVAAELLAVQAALPDLPILFTPANPAVGRTVRDGMLLVHGVPVAETEFARDPASRVWTSSLRELLGRAATERVIIPDAATMEDLEREVFRQGSFKPWLGVGSGALAVAVAQMKYNFHGYKRPRWRRDPLQKIPTGPVLIVCGSAHSANRAQAARLAGERGVRVIEIALADPEEAAGRAMAELRAQRSVALLVEPRSPANPIDAQVALRAILIAATRTIEVSGVARVFVMGGETASALCRALGVPRLQFLAEIEPGMALAQAKAKLGRMRLAVKPGGFGSESAWVRAFDALLAQRFARP